MKEMYGQLLPYAMHRADLNYLLDIMGAEIGSKVIGLQACATLKRPKVFK